jgi:predicted ArsR family transcriptional regulator
MTDAEDTPGNVNQAVRADWEAETTPYERIRAVISRTYTPTTADDIADSAVTSPKTARKHLETLADEGFVTTEAGENGATLYSRSGESLVVEQAAEMRSELSTDELRRRVDEMRDQLKEFQETYGVNSPEELTIEQTNELLAETAPGQAAADEQTIRRWKTTRRNLAFANAALSIANAEEFVDRDSGVSNRTISSS